MNIFTRVYYLSIAYIAIIKYTYDWLLDPTMYKIHLGDSGCGTVDSVIAFDTRGPGFKSSHRQLKLNNCLLLTANSKYKIKICRECPIKIYLG